MKLDYIIKIGGSILYDLKKAKKLLDVLETCLEGKFAITVGSGMLGELYKDYIKNLEPNLISFEDSVRNFSNIQSINASVLSSLNQNYCVCENTAGVYHTLNCGKLPILDSRGFIKVFGNDLYQKGDVRAANLCNYFNCKNLIIITNVSGVYDKDPNKSHDSHLLKKITTSELKKMGRTSVDPGLADRIEEYNLNCFVLGVDNLIKIENINMLESGTKIERGDRVYEKRN